MHIEKKRIVPWITRSGSVGHIELDHLAIPETMKITLLDEPIIPISFDHFGHPNFTKEQEMLFIFKEEEIRRQNGGRYVELKAEILYEERIFDIPREQFDTVNGIKESLHSLSGLNEIIRNRSIFHKAYESERLNEFVVFGRYLLDCWGRVRSIDKVIGDQANTKGDIEDCKILNLGGRADFFLTYTSHVIPPAGIACPCCGRKFTISDIKSNPTVFVNDKYYHASCWHNYEKLTEIDRLTRRVMSTVYGEASYQFELLPDSYRDGEHLPRVPWLLFHTVDGDIIIGHKGHTISIEWQSNYEYFDIDSVFGSEDATVWQISGRRGIRAQGEAEACRYLKKVLQAVNPSYYYG